MTDDSPLASVELHLVNSVDEAMAFKRWLGERRAGDVLGVDTETGGFRPERDPLRLVQFGDLQQGWAVPWHLWGGVALEALNAYEGQVALHNAPFDGRFLQLHGGWRLPWDRTHDTMTMAHLKDPTRPKGLKPLSARLVDRRATAGQQALNELMIKHHWTWATVPVDLPEYWVYGALDPVLTAHCYDRLRGDVLTTYREAYELEMGALAVITQMMLKGIRVDRGYCEAKVKELRDWADEARVWLRREYGLENATSNLQIIAALQRTGVTLTRCTKDHDGREHCALGHQLAVDKEVLEPLALRGHPVAQYVVQVRKADKICGSYLEHFLEFADQHDRVYPNINSLGAVTSRMSISQPSLQNLHREDPTVRNAVVPDPGNVLVTADSDQIEARLMAHFSGDAGLIAAFNEPGDFFCTIAAQIWGEPVVKGDRRRQLTKNTIYGKQYGAGVETMADTAGVEVATMEPVVAAFDARFPGVAQFMGQVQAVARRRLRDEGVAYVTTPYGRREVASDTSKLYVLVNYLLQGHAAECLKRSLIEADSLGLTEYLEVPVHDELVTECPADLQDEVARALETAMTNTTDYQVALTASATVFPERWGPKP